MQPSTGGSFPEPRPLEGVPPRGRPPTSFRGGGGWGVGGGVFLKTLPPQGVPPPVETHLGRRSTSDSRVSLKADLWPTEVRLAYSLHWCHSSYANPRWFGLKKFQNPIVGPPGDPLGDQAGRLADEGARARKSKKISEPHSRAPGRLTRARGRAGASRGSGNPHVVFPHTLR